MFALNLTKGGVTGLLSNLSKTNIVLSGAFSQKKRSMTSTVPDWLPHMLQNESFLQYHSYYHVSMYNGKKIRHNHKAHGIVALAFIGSSEERTRKYVDYYNKNGLVQVDGDPEKEQETEKDYIKSDKIEDYKGRNQAFYKILDHYTKLYKEKYNGDYEALLRGELPSVSDGQIIGAFHGVIQTGYGLAGKSPQVVLEGLANYYHQYSPSFPDDPNNPKRNDLSKFGHGKTELLDILEKLRNTKGLVENVDQDNAKDRPYRMENHYFGAYGWGAWKYHSELFVDLADDLKLPDWFDVNKRDHDLLMRLMDWLLDNAFVLFVKSEVINDFFILHGITAAWSMKKVLPYMDYDTGLRAIRSYVWGVLMVYVCQGTPPLSKSPEDYWKDGKPDQAKWDKVNKETVAGDYETHVYKVVQCGYDRWKENPHSELAEYYIAAANISRSHHFGRGMQNLGETFPNDFSFI